MKGKKTVRRKVTHRKRGAETESAGDRIKRTWQRTVGRLSAAEARFGKQVRGLLKRNRIGTRDAASVLRDLRVVVDREGKRGLRELEARFAGLQARMAKERKNAAKAVESAVQGALATFNIPSRQEVQELSRKVGELSRKIDSFKR